MTSTTSTTELIPESLAAKKRQLLELMLSERRAQKQQRASEFPRIDRSQPLPLSFAQQRLWFLNRLDPQSPAYNIPAAVYLVGRLDPGALARAYRMVLDRHEDLRTHFHTSPDGAPFATIASESAQPLPLIDLSALPPATAEELAQALVPAVSLVPFDIGKDSLLRLFLLRLAPEDHVLLLVIHHIVADVWSIGVFFRDVGACYDAVMATRSGRAGGEPALPPLALQYADYVLWQRQQLEETGELDRQLKYWVGKLAGAQAVIDLPIDFPRPPRQTFRGRRHIVRLGGDVNRRLQELALPEEASLYMAALAVFYVLLYRYTGQREILVGTPMANRSRVELEQLVGFFVNTAVLRAGVSGDLTFRQLLRQVRETTLEAFAHQELPFDRVVSSLRLERDLSRNPLYQVDFAFQNLPAVELATPGLSLKPFTLRETTSRFDLEFDLKESADGFDGFIRYNVALFVPATIERMARHYQALLAEVLADADRPVAALRMLSAEEAGQLLHTWNATAGRGAAAATALDLIEEQVARVPEAPAVIASNGSTLTFGELDRRAALLARHLLAAGTAVVEPVALALPRSADLLAALLAVWKVGAAYVPIDPGHPPARLRFQLADAGVRRVLATAALLAELPFLAADGRAVLCVDDLPEAAVPVAPMLTALRPGPEHAAYVLYTSGSTGQPKGVVVHHGGLANYLDWCRHAYGLAAPAAERAGSLVHSPLGFDLTVTSLLAPLAAGVPVRLAAEGDGIEPLLAALRGGLFSTGGCSLIKITPAHLEALSELLTPREAAQAAGTVVIGGEALRWETLAFWRRYAPASRLINEYGPTETVVGCAIHEAGAGGAPGVFSGDEVGDVPIGRPIQNMRLHAVDADGNLTPAGVPGELWIGGAGVARGYLNRPELTAARFVPDPFSEQPGERLYRSGDRVRRLPGGELLFLGRLDHQVKVRGFRIELGEIETILAAHPDVQAAAVLVRRDTPAGVPALVAYVAAPKARNLGAEELRAHLAGQLPEHMVPQLFVFLPALPLTPNGKVDRRALPSPDERLSRDADYVAPRTPSEMQVARIWAEVLRVDRVSVNDRFFELGGQSMLAVQVVSRVRDALQVELPVQSLFNETTVASLAAEVDTAVARGAVADAPPVTPVPRDGDLPLSFAQERLWFIDQLMPGLTAYNIPGAVRMRGWLDRPALARALNEIISRHEVLRTTFATRRGRPVQVVAPEMPLEIATVDLAAAESETPEERWERAMALAREAVRTPFDLARGPLLRASLLELGPEDVLFVMVIHHIVYDMWSRDVFLGELVTLYEAFSEGRGSNLPPLAVQYADFAVWQRRWLSGEVLEKQLGYWRGQLAGVEPLELPTDRPRPAVQTMLGARATRALSPELTAALKRFSRRRKVTLFVTLLSGFYALLARYTGARDLVIGSPIANRNRVEIEALMGFFANTLVLRARLAAGVTAEDLLAQVSRLTLDAYSHQDLAFERLVSEIQPERDLGRQPFFQVMFNFLINYKPPTLQLPKLALETEQVHTGGVPFDFTLSMYETEGRLHTIVDYATDLFDRLTVDRMLAHFERMLAALAAAPAQPLESLPLLDAAERFQIVHGWNEPAGEPALAPPLSRWVEAQVARTPDAPAVVSGTTAWTYRELSSRANRLAHVLRRHGVGADSVVAIAVERSLEMAAAVLGVIKAGAAYLPLDASYPADRLAFMLADADCAVLLTQEHLLADLPTYSGTTLLLPESCEGEGEGEPAVEVDGDHLGYLIYTSGSTGRPKGIAMTQRALSNLVAWQVSILPPGGLRTLQLASLSFDASFTEMLSAWSTGGCIVLITRDERQDLAALGRLLAARRIERAILPVVALQQLAQLLDEPPAGLREIVSTGEQLQITGDVRRFFAVPGASRLRNDYGPSETHVVTTHVLDGPPEAWAAQPPIGRPIPGTRMHVLDAELQPSPLGVIGEAWLGGVCLARGYLKRPDLTAAAFCPDPFAFEPGGRIYRTGDLARYRADGTLDFLGRIDHQVKIRGFRVEPAEVQAALDRHPGVESCAVVARRDGGAQRLVAYLVAAQRPEVGALRAFLLETLPEYMVPAAWVYLDALPLNANGKLDRAALPAPGGERTGQRAYVAPHTPVEETLAAIWGEVLGAERVGVEDSFFDLGGHSLLGVQVISRISEAFGIELPLRQIFAEPTVAGLARTVERLMWALRGSQAGSAETGEEEGEI